MTEIKQAAFYESNLQEVTFAEGSRLRAVGKQAFYGCRFLTYIDLPEGTLTVEGTEYTITTEGTQTPRITGVIGYVKAYYTDSLGIRYPVINPHIKNETICSMVDLSKGYYELVGYVDSIARENEKIRQDLRETAALVKPDSRRRYNRL